MAKSPTEQVREIERDLIAYRERLSHTEKAIPDPIAADRDLERVVAELRRENADLRQELALVRQRLDEHLKRVELWDSRRWGLVVAVLLALFGAALSFAAGLDLAQYRK